LFIAKKQSKFVEAVKLKLGKKICIAVAENYTCFVQNAALGFHWHHIQVTLHHFVLYFREEGKRELQFLSLCFVSTKCEHDTNMLSFQEPGIHEKWHFFATSHGINVCDGTGGILKCFATRARLQKTT
jgi:hypothetical protein